MFKRTIIPIRLAIKPLVHIDCGAFERVKWNKYLLLLAAKYYVTLDINLNAQRDECAIWKKFIQKSANGLEK